MVVNSRMLAVAERHSVGAITDSPRRIVLGNVTIIFGVFVTELLEAVIRGIPPRIRKIYPRLSGYTSSTRPLDDLIRLCHLYTISIALIFGTLSCNSHFHRASYWLIVERKRHIVISHVSMFAN